MKWLCQINEAQPSLSENEVGNTPSNTAFKNASPFKLLNTFPCTFLIYQLVSMVFHTLPSFLKVMQLLWSVFRNVSWTERTCENISSFCFCFLEISVIFSLDRTPCQICKLISVFAVAHTVLNPSSQEKTQTYANNLHFFSIQVKCQMILAMILLLLSCQALSLL